MDLLEQAESVSLGVSCWALAVVALAGCANQNHYVIATSATVIGVEISQNPATQSPQAKLGYNRAEVAIVPSNRSMQADPNQPPPRGAQEVPDVLMELRYDGIFALNDKSGIYQRLAVGTEAVRQPGAAAMFLRNSAGDIAPEAAKTIANKVEALRSLGIGSSDSNKRIRAWLYGTDNKIIKERFVALQQWMNNDKIDPLLQQIPVEVFIDGDNTGMESDRQRAIDDLHIPSIPS